MKRLALAVMVLVSVLLLGVAVASVVASSHQSPNAKRGDPSERHEMSGDTEQAGVHGGPIDRFRGSGCSLTNVSAFQDNWTHGDYVSAVAVTGDSTLIFEAAHSDCGKPMVSASHGTDHASTKTEKHESMPAPGS